MSERIQSITEFSLGERFPSSRRGPAGWIAAHAMRYWYLGLALLIGALGNALLAAAVPILIGQAVNAMQLPTPDLGTLGRIAVLIVISQVVRSVLQLGRNFSAELIGQRLERDIRNELYISLLGKSMTFHSLRPIGDTMARATNDVREINLMFSPGMNLVIGSANFLLVPLLLAGRYHPSLVLTPAVFILAYFLSLWQYLHELNPITEAVRESFGGLNTRLAEAIDGVETVKGTAQEGEEARRFAENARRYRDAFVRQGRVEARFLPLLWLGAAEAGSLLHALILFSRGALDTGGVVAYFGMIQLFGFPTFVSLFAYSQVSSGIAGARRILELINQENHLDQNPNGHAGPMRGEIEFRNVTFAYEDGKPALEGITFKVKAGQTVAIVGQTGAGKTTLARLINRTYDVSSGQVLVDGVDVRDWNLEALRQNISMIEQDVFLFSRTIAENISFGRPGASEEEIVRAAAAAQAEEFIQTIGEGYQTLIGERGVTLSGGQRQRLALARALLTDPPVFILDDSTSAIDSATEDRIQRAIYRAARGRTTLLITHRLSQIRWADHILVLRNGRLAAQGSHEELMRSSEAYRRIFNR